MKQHTLFVLALIWVIVLSGLPTSGFAQKKKTEQDTLQARILLNAAYALMDSFQFDRTAEKASQAASLSSSMGNGESRLFADALCLEGRAQASLGNLDTAFILLRKALTMREKLLDEPHHEIAEALVSLGECFVHAVKPDSAITYLAKALEMQEKTFGISHPDLVRTLNAFGLATQGKRDFELAIAHFHRAIEICRKNYNTETAELATIYSSLGGCLLLKGDFQGAADTLAVAEELKLRLFNDANHSSLIITYINLGGVHKRMSHSQTAEEYFQKAKTTLSASLPVDSLGLANVSFNLAQLYTEIGDFEQALENYKQAKELWEKKLGHEHNYIGIVLSDIGHCYNEQGNLDSAILYDNLALDFYKKTGGASSFNEAVALTNLGACITGKGDFDEAIQYFYTALDILLGFKEPNWDYITSVYGNLGIAYKNKGGKMNYNKATHFFNKALELNRQVYGLKHPITATIYNSLGTLYNAQGNLDSAIINLNSSRDIMSAYFPKGHHRIALIDYHLARCYRDIGDYETADSLCNLALDFWGNSTLKTPDAALPQLEKGNILWKKRQYEESQKWYSKARVTLGYTSPYDYKNVVSMDELIPVLDYQGQSLLDWYNATGNKTALQQAYQVILEADSAFHFQYRKLKQPGSQETLAKNVHRIYENAISVALNLSASNPLANFSEKAFHFAESSKARTLQSAMHASNALHFSDIPPELTQAEKTLRLKILELEKRRPILERQIRKEADSLSRDKLNRTYFAVEARLFELNKKADSLQTVFEKDYTKYYNLKYNPGAVSIQQIQNELLNANQTLLEYFAGDSSIFIFLLQKDQYKVVEVQNVDNLNTLASQMVRGIDAFYSKKRQSKKVYEASNLKYTSAAYRLYQKLIAPMDSLLTEELIIIPDGVLGYIPFEALLKVKPEDPVRFRTHQYLVNEHSVSYAQSVILLKQMVSKKHRDTPLINGLVMAPWSQGRSVVLDTLLANVVNKNEFRPLLYSSQEADSVRRIIKGEVVFDSLATLEWFKERAPLCRFIHLSTHGLANRNVGDYSLLAFYPRVDGNRESNLYVRDIYNLSLNTDMVVLSACETAVGELRRGEGIIGMTRAFTYAGTKSLFVTLWQVNDKATKDLVVSFYNYLKKGLSKGKALQQTKLDLIKSGVKEAHPYFWAGMIGIGDMQTVQFSN